MKTGAEQSPSPFLSPLNRKGKNDLDPQQSENKEETGRGRKESGARGDGPSLRIGSLCSL